jgi:DNA helicase II / ATP-dependent DNA helicase PcrA
MYVCAVMTFQLDNLNPAQRAAVQQIEGPVLVIAGPGTGKTHILATRIGKILLETDAQPQNILCLTFTDAGAHAMRERLQVMIGAEAHRLQISTFHGFCNRVIQENAEYFGRRDLELVTDLERIEFIRNLLQSLPSSHALRKDQKNTYAFERQLNHLFSMMKREDWTPGHIQRQTRKYLEELPFREEYIYKVKTKTAKKGDLKQDEIDAQKQKMERLDAAADLYPKFNAAMHREGRYDYDDMILWTIREFEKHEMLLRQYQERYLYVLVDEYQDTNGAQNHLLHLLINYWDNPNIFIVGDDDQSIYEFQGARLKNILDFYEKYKNDLLLVVLEENYRSTQSILDGAKNLIERNKIRAISKIEISLEKNLTANFVSEVRPQVNTYANPLAETADIIQQIEQLLKTGVAPTEIAILYAKHRQSDRLMSILDKKEIPYETKRPINVLDMPLIRQLHTLLKYIFEESEKPFSADHRLFEILHFRFLGLKSLDIALIGTAIRQELSEEEVDENNTKKKPIFWREKLSNIAFLKAAGIENIDKIIAFHEKSERWQQDLYDFSLPAFLEKIINQSGLLGFTLQHADRIFLLQAINSFLGYAQKEAVRNPRYDLARFLEQLETRQKNDLSLPLQQHIKTGEGIQLLTAHGSKGLEFQHVFLMGCTDDFWEKRRNNTQGRFTLPDTLTFSGTEDDTEAQRRLFYVACTRAKEHLQISFAQKNADDKPTNGSVFISETKIPIVEKAVSQDTLFEIQSLLLLDSNKPTITLPDTVRMDEMLKDFKLSPTSFNRYLRCPLAFYYQDILKVPDVSSEAAQFGQAMHKALQDLFLQMRKSQGQFPSDTAFVGYFEHEMDEYKANFGPENFKQFKYLGKEFLLRYYRDKRSTWNKNSEVERRIQAVEVEGVPITGVVDRFERADTRLIRVIDYKTGQQRPEKIASPNEKQPHGGDYWRQLVFYKILLEARMPEEGVVFEGVISYLEPDKKGTFPEKTVVFKPEDVFFVKNLLKEVNAKIRSKDFTTGCGEKDCVWCRMHRENETPTGWENEEEGLDD